MSEPRKAVRVDGAWLEIGNEPVEVAGRVIRAAWLVGQSAEDLAEAGIEAADIVPAERPADARVVGSHIENVDGTPTEVLETEAYSVEDVANMRAAAVGAVKREAERRIFERYPIARQLNAIRANEPLDWIDEVRSASDAIEAALPEDAAGLLAFNASAAAGWPE